MEEIKINQIIEAIKPAITEIVMRNINEEEITRIIKEKVLIEVEKTIKETIAEVVIKALKRTPRPQNK